MKRYNIFNQIHKALRAMLYDTALTLQQTDFDVQEQADKAIAKVKTVIHLFDEHAHHEDNYILPAVERFDSSITEAFAKEHVLDLELAKQLDERLSAVENALDAEEKVCAGELLNKSFNCFMVFNLKHMAKEENLLNKLLWEHYADSEILQIAKTISQKNSPESMAVAAKWMMKGMSNEEIINWLKIVEQVAPSPMFEALLAIGRSELPSERFEMIATSVPSSFILN